MDETTNVTLGLVKGSEPIAGQLAAPGGAARAFSGYMELIAALDAVRGADAGELGTDVPSTGRAEGDEA